MITQLYDSLNDKECIFRNYSNNKYIYNNKYYTSKWIYLKPNNGNADEKRDYRLKKFIYQLEKNNSKYNSMDAIQKYNIEHTNYLINSIKNYRKKNNIVDKYTGEIFPNINTITCKGCNNHYLINLNFVNHKLCKNCIDLNIPYYQNINSIPNLVRNKNFINDNDRNIIINKQLTQKLNKESWIKKIDNNENISSNDLKYFDKSFIEFVKNNRLKLFLTQDQFARRINYSSKIIQDFELGTLLYDNKLFNVINNFFNSNK